MVSRYPYFWTFVQKLSAPAEKAGTKVPGLKTWSEEYAIYQVDQVLLAKKWLEENRRNNIQSSKQSHKDEIGEESKGLDTRQGDYKKDSSQDGENPNTTKLQTLKKARKAIKRKGWARRTAIKLLPLMLCSKRHCLECIYAGKCFVC